MIAYAWPGSSVIHFGDHLLPGCIELASGPMGTVAESVYQTSIWDGHYFDIPDLADALAAKQHKLAYQIRDQYVVTLRAKINELLARRESVVSV